MQPQLKVFESEKFTSIYTVQYFQRNFVCYEFRFGKEQDKRYLRTEARYREVIFVFLSIA
jgi:hypothetical protein